MPLESVLIAPVVSDPVIREKYFDCFTLFTGRPTDCCFDRSNADNGDSGSCSGVGAPG